MMIGETFDRSGLGYRCGFTAEQVHIIVDHIRRTREGVTAELLVQTSMPSFGPYVRWGRLNLLSTSTRTQFANACAHRTKGAEIDWDAVIETVCRRVITAERQSQPFTTVGRREVNQVNPWLIRDLLYRAEPTALYGDGGTGKSRIALAAGLSIQTGHIFLPHFRPLITGPFLYMDWEANEDRMDTRVKALCKGMGIEPVDVAYRACTEPLQDQVEDVARYCLSERILLVIIDSVEMAMAGTKDGGSDANDSAVKLYASLRSIGVASLLIDHITKAEGDHAGPRKQYGSAFKRNLARMQFELRAAEDSGKEEDCFHIGLFHRKRNDDGKLIRPIGFRVGFDAAATVYEDEEIRGDLKSSLGTTAAIFQTLKESSVMMTSQQISDASGKPYDSVKTTLSGLVKNGKMVHKGEKYGLPSHSYEPF